MIFWVSWFEFSWLRLVEVYVMMMMRIGWSVKGIIYTFPGPDSGFSWERVAELLSDMKQKPASSSVKNGMYPYV